MYNVRKSLKCDSAEDKALCVRENVIGKHSTHVFKNVEIGADEYSRDFRPFHTVTHTDGGESKYYHSRVGRDQPTITEVRQAVTWEIFLKNLMFGQLGWSPHILMATYDADSRKSKFVYEDFRFVPNQSSEGVQTERRQMVKMMMKEGILPVLGGSMVMVDTVDGFKFLHFDLCEMFSDANMDQFSAADRQKLTLRGFSPKTFFTINDHSYSNHDVDNKADMSVMSAAELVHLVRSNDHSTLSAEDAKQILQRLWIEKEDAKHLFLAAVWQHRHDLVAVFRYLFSPHELSEIVDDEGNTAMHLAVGDEEMMKKLVRYSKHWKVGLPNKMKITPLDLAIAHYHVTGDKSSLNVVVNLIPRYDDSQEFAEFENYNDHYIELVLRNISNFEEFVDVDNVVWWQTLKTLPRFELERRVRFPYPEAILANRQRKLKLLQEIFFNRDYAQWMTLPKDAEMRAFLSEMQARQPVFYDGW
jgi:hypothetical protein